MPALRSLVHSAQVGTSDEVRTDLQVIGDSRELGPELDLALYRIAQEGLTNCRKHAGASEARVRLTFEEGRVLLEVVDNGVGFQRPTMLADLAQQGRYGLLGIQERVWALGGTLTMESSPGRGTLVRVSVPA